MLRVAEGLRNHVKALLRANQISWEQGMPRVLLYSIQQSAEPEIRRGVAFTSVDVLLLDFMAKIRIAKRCT